MEAGEGYFTFGTHSTQLPLTYMKYPTCSVLLHIIVECDYRRIFAEEGNTCLKVVNTVPQAVDSINNIEYFVHDKYELH
jgi:hypothetical protein